MKRLLIFLFLLLVSIPVLAQDADPIPTPDPMRYDNLRERINARGFPQIGFSNAPVSAIVYVAFDDPLSGLFYRDGYAALINHVRTGEILLTVVPLAGRGDIPTGRGAARGAICAGEQNKFFAYHDLLFTWQLQFGEEAYAGTRLIDAANQVSVDRATWDACMSSDLPDGLLVESDAVVAFLPTFTTTPFVTLNEVPSLLDSVSILANIEFSVLENQATFDAVLNATDNPNVIPTFDPNATIDPESTEPVVLTLEPLLNQEVPPPLEITLPQGWQRGYNVIVLQDLDAIRNMPIAVYTGPITGGTGVIVLLWGFPNILPSTAETFTPNLFSDGLRLLPVAVVEPECNIGTDLRRDYSIGGLAAAGTQFAAVDCPDNLPDTRGWFAGLQQFNLNFVFYVFTEPISAMDVAEGELQAILDTVRFVLPEITPEVTDTP